MYLVMKALAAMLARLTPQATDRLAWGVTFVVFDVLRVRRKLVERNIERALGTAYSAVERTGMARRSVYNFVLTALEFLRSYKLDIAEDIEMRGVEHIREALDRDGGAYILCLHMGNWEAMGAKVTRALVPAHVLVKRVGGQGVNRFVTELRDKNGFLSVRRAKKGDGLRAINAAIKKGEIIGFVMDQARPGEPKLPFFGHPAKTNTSFAAIWRRIRAPIIPAFIVRTGINRHVLEFMPEVKPDVTDDAAADVLRHSAMFNQVVENIVRKHPDQYLWMHNRWK